MKLMGPQGEQLPAQALIIMGVSGSGKSTLASVLAERLACPFLEGDAFHSEANVAKMRGGEPLTDADRWPWLDRLGGAIGAAARSEDVAVAACSALKRIYRDRLRDAAGVPTRFILLEAGREELARRLNSRSDHYMPASLLDSQLGLLEYPDADESALTLDGMLAPSELAGRVLEWLAADRPVAARKLA
jgi:gluconokinase